MKIIADENIPFVQQCFSSIGDVEVVPGREIKPETIAEADILLVRSVTRVNSDLLAKSSVRFVGTATIGFEHINVELLSKNHVGFASAQGCNANSVAEYVIAALLEIGQKYNIKLQNKLIGVIGVGNIGSKVAKKCAALGMKVRLNDPPLRRQTGEVKYQPLKKLFDCDFITLHTPLTFKGADKTFHLADEKFFKSLKAECVFLNTARGAVVGTDALKNAIKSGRLKATVLDVWENEPKIDIELLEMVDIGTPHIAGYSLDGKVAGMIMIYKKICKYFKLKPKFDVDSFLPQPAVPELKINPTNGSEQDVPVKAVEKIYDIKKDDANLRLILNMPLGKRCGLFEKLRRDYHIRREFGNTQIVLEAPSKTFTDKLAGIGFEV